MDNNENSPVEAEGATSPAENDANITQTEEPTVETEGGVSDAETEEADGEADKASLLAGKFKTPQELEKAYQELQHKLGDTSQKAELANLLEKQTGMNHQQIKEYLAQQERLQQQQYYANNPLAPVLDKVSVLEQKLAIQEQKEALGIVEKEADKFIKANPAYETHRDKIMKLALTPGIGFNLQTGEETPISEIARDYFGEARAQGQQDAYKKIDKKVMTQATGVSKAPPRGKITLDELKGMSAAEQAAILPHRQE